jgi:hypothetical protein
MKKTIHPINLQYQPTNRSCAYTSVAMLLDNCGVKEKIEDLVTEIPELKDKDGNERGGIAQEVATQCLGRGMSVDMYTFDCQIIDLSWAGLANDELIARLKVTRQNRDIPNLGKDLTQRYIDAYIDFLEKGGKLHILPVAKTKLLYQLLDKRPLFINACPHILFNEGRLLYPELRKSKLDDISGEVSIHSLVIKGYDEIGNFLLSDPFYGERTIEAETLTGAVMAAAIGCDSLCFQIAKR